MNNIVIYSTKPMPELQATLMDIDEAEVRVVLIDKMKDYYPNFIESAKNKSISLKHRYLAGIGIFNR